MLRITKRRKKSISPAELKFKAKKLTIITKKKTIEAGYRFFSSNVVLQVLNIPVVNKENAI